MPSPAGREGAAPSPAGRLQTPATGEMSADGPQSAHCANGAYFYAIAFVWTLLEGETFVLFAGLPRRRVWLIGVLWSRRGSAALPAIVYFLAGAPLGVRLDRFPLAPRCRPCAALARTLRCGFILSFRFIYGVRNFSSFALGLSAVRWQRFLWLNFTAAGLWAASFVTVGYFLGHAFRAMLGDLARSFSLVMLGVFVAIGAGMWLLHRLQRRRQLRVPPGADVVLPPS